MMLISKTMIKSVQKANHLNWKQALRMFSFEYTDTQKNFQQEVLRFAKQEIIPIEKKHDKTGEFPTELIKKAYDLGYMNVIIPEKYGGPGLKYSDFIIIGEALSYGCSGIALTMNGPALSIVPLMMAGSEETKKKYLEMLASGPNSGALAVTEPTAGSDVSGIKTRAVKEGDEYILNGTKCWITGGGPAKYFVVLAKTSSDPKTPTNKAFTMFVVDGDAEGVIRGKKEDMLGQRASDTRSITFENVRVKKENVLGKEGDGFGICMKTFDATRPLVACMGCGISWRALDESIKWALERETFGQKIYKHQAIQFILADMATNLELFRLMTYKSAFMTEKNMPNALYFASIAKVSAADQTQNIVSNAVQVFGGAGFNKEYPVEKLIRDAKILQIYEGTSQIQKIIIGRHLLQHVAATGSSFIE